MKPEVYLIGVGMGGPGTLTLAARAAIDRCAVLVGAPRLLEPYGDKPCRALIAAGDILAVDLRDDKPQRPIPPVPMALVIISSVS